MFWTGTAFLFYLLLTSQGIIAPDLFLELSKMLVFSGLVFFVNYYFLADDLLVKKNTIAYLIKIIGLALMLLLLLNVSETYIFESTRPLSNNDYLFGFFLVVYVIAFSLFYKDYATTLGNKENMLRLIKEKNEFEVNMLKSQFSPHFLFNTLNSIYSKCHDTSPEAAKMIHNLSNFMRYLIDECSRDKVLIQREVLMIHDFINLYKLNHSNEMNIVFKHKLFDASQQIAPMLLLNFVENAFKHSNMASSRGSFVEIELATDQQSLYFKVKNNKVPILNRLEKGIGNKNTIMRLELDYKNSYVYEVKETEKEYEMDLKIKL